MERFVVKRLDSIFPIAICLILFLFQLQYIELGHFWDEAWVYAPAIRTMALAFPSILPDAIPVGLSRGHPLLFQFLGAIWVLIFGDSNTSLHLYALSISCTILIVSYYGLRSILNTGAAVAITLIIATSPMFIAQSAMVYPEMLMTLGLLIALFGYIKTSRFQFAFGLTMALLCKESALAFFCGFIAFDLIKVLLGQSQRTWFLGYLIPLMAIVFHPISLYLTHGWFLFPEHTDFVVFNYETIKYNSIKVFEFLFESQGRGWVIFPVMLLSILLIRMKHWVYNIVILLAVLAALWALSAAYEIQEWIFIISILAALAAPLVIWWFFRKKKSKLNPSQSLVLVGYIITIGFIVFSAMNFFTERYLLPIVLLLAVMVVVLIWYNNKVPFYVKAALSAGVVVVNVFLGIDFDKRGENNLGLYNDLLVQENAVNWLIENVEPDATICTDFVYNSYISNPLSGYVTEEQKYYAHHHLICSNCEDSEIVIVSQTNDCYDQEKSKWKEHNLLYTDTAGRSNIAIYSTTQ